MISLFFAETVGIGQNQLENNYGIEIPSKSCIGIDFQQKKILKVIFDLIIILEKSKKTIKMAKNDLGKS